MVCYLAPADQYLATCCRFCVGLQNPISFTMAATYDSDTERYRKWYDPDLEEVNSQIRYLLELYSKVPPGDVVSHVNKIV
jgi:hypothetical protein